MDLILRGILSKRCFFTDRSDIFPGTLGAPDDPVAVSETITTKRAGQHREYPVVNLVTLVASKLGAIFGRSNDNDISDVIFLIQTYPEQIQALKAQLSLAHRQEFVNVVSRKFGSTTDHSFIKTVKVVLAIE